MTARLCARAVLALVLAALAPVVMGAQAGPGTAELREQLQQRYDVAALQNGVALIPRQRGGDVRIIEVRDGAVAVNGEQVTARELREQVGADADLILRVTYLDAAALRELAGPGGVPAPPALPAPPDQAGAPQPPPETPAPRRSERFEGERVRVMGDLTVAQDELIDGDVVVVMGSARIDGEVDGEVAVVMGSLTLGPTAVIRQDVNVIGGSITRDPGARVEGAINNVGMGGMGWPIGGMREMMRDAFIWRIGGLAATLLRVALLVLLTLVVVAFGRGMVERIADRAAVDALRAGLIGLLAELLFFPLLVITCIVLAVSIIGIPLLVLVPFAILLALLVLLVGFTGVAYHIGRALHGRFGWTERGAYASVALGVVVIVGLTVIARSAAILGGDLLGFPLTAMGYVVEYAAWTVGFGAAILAWLRSRRPEVRIPALP